MILLVTGAEGVRVRERVHEFVEHFVQKYDPQRLNLEFFREGTAFSVVRDQLLAAPFLAEKRMVVLTGFLRDASKSALAEWQDLFAKLPASTIVVVAEMDVDSLAFAWLTALPDAKAYPLKALTDAERHAWMLDRARRYGGRFSAQAWELFLQAVGGDLSRADLELDKVTTFADGCEISVEDIRLLVPPHVLDDGPFAFSNALSGSRPAVFSALRQERARGVADFLLMGTLLRTARTQLQVKAISRQPVGDAPKELGLHPYVFKKEVASLGRRTFGMLVERLRLGGVMDRRLKRGLPADIAVDRFLADFL